jgi:hypothetical protein
MADAPVQRHRRSRGEAGARLGSAETPENRPRRSFRHESPRERFRAKRLRPCGACGFRPTMRAASAVDATGCHARVVSVWSRL